MNRDDFRQLVASRVILLDGATGTELLLRGMPAGACPEKWALDNPGVLQDLQREYCQAGSDIVYTCTFGGNRIKLAEFGLADAADEINTSLAGLSREAAGSGLVFGNLAPTGKLVEPFGDLGFEECVGIFRQQVLALIAGGVDGFVVETMMDVQEARAAVLAVREACDLPLLVSMTYGEKGRTLTGTDPTAALITLQALGADAVGCNCSTGPADMLAFIHAMKPHATVPLLAKPNAGMPELRDGVTVFSMGAEEFAGFATEFVARGVNLLGGCCGSSPEFIARLRQTVAGSAPIAPVRKGISAASSVRRAAFFGPDRPLGIIGERINPTGKKKLQESLRAGRLDLVREYALQQAEAGAAMLDVNFGLSGVDERELMVKAVSLISQIVETPLSIDTTNARVMEAALRIYPGRALVNSISGERERIEKMLPIAAKYGAMFVLLPLTDGEVPATAQGRIEVVQAVRAAALEQGLQPEDIVVDGLVMAVSAEPRAGQETLQLLDWARQQGLNTVIGTSNVSFGLPERRWLNAAFLAMAADRGLTLAIANPCEELTMPLKFATDALAGRDPHLAEYVARLGKAADRSKCAGEAPARSPQQRVFDCVLMGDEDGMVPALEAALAGGASASELVDNQLIPAIARVGELFDRKEYFLPQLMMGAQAMKKAFDRLDPLLREAGAGAGPGKGISVILATVKGDIHDIGKNLVGLMLRNYGFQVVDLGKDVSARDIVAAAAEHRARIVGLSALMTTTMVEMREVIELTREQGLDTRFMVGGAVVDSNYAAEIGADGYSRDALGAVRLAEKLAEG